MADSTVVQMLVAGRDDMNWFDSNLNSFLLKYNTKFIAFSNKTIIESDANLDSLMNKLDSKGIDTSTVFIKFISNVKSIL